MKQNVISNPRQSEVRYPPETTFNRKKQALCTTPILDTLHTRIDGVT
jgi:hypothetical protein